MPKISMRPEKIDYKYTRSARKNILIQGSLINAAGLCVYFFLLEQLPAPSVHQSTLSEKYLSLRYVGHLERDL